MSPSTHSRLPPLRIEVVGERLGEDPESRIVAFAAACGSRRGLRIDLEPDVARLSVDPRRIEKLGPHIEAAAVAHGLTILIPELNAELRSSGLDGSPSRVWIAVGRAALEAEIASERGEIVSFDPFRYVRIDEIDGRRQAIEDLPPFVEPTHPLDGAYMSDPTSLGVLGPVKYDDAGWHADGAIEAGQPVEQAFVHIGLYLAWLIRHDLHERTMLPREHVAALKSGEMTGSDLADDIDGKFTSDMLTAEGSGFTHHYYPKYLDAYNVVFEAEPEYGVEDTAANYERIAPVLDQAYQTWVAAGRPPPEAEDPDQVIETPAQARGPGVPDSMTKAELDAYMEAAFLHVDAELVFVGDLERPHVAPGLERLLVERLGLAADDVSSVSAGEWQSSLLNRALKRLGVRPRDAVVVSALAGDGEDAVMVALYSVPGASASALETEFASAIHKPSARTWQWEDVAGQRVQVAKGRDFIGIYWAIDGLVFHLGASATVDLTDLVARLAKEPRSIPSTNGP